MYRYDEFDHAFVRERVAEFKDQVERRLAGALSEDEWQLMRQHTIVGERILAASPGLGPVGHLVRASHERWDGNGYPDGLCGEAIPLGARIISVCDTFDAIVSDRPYAAGRSITEALTELRRCAGSQFDPVVVDAFVRAADKGGGLVLSSPLEPNINHKGTAFAGSLNATATLTGRSS